MAVEITGLVARGVPGSALTPNLDLVRERACRDNLLVFWRLRGKKLGHWGYS